MEKYRIEWDETSYQTYFLDVEAKNESDAELDLTKIPKSTLTMDKEYEIVRVAKVLL